MNNSKLGINNPLIIDSTFDGEMITYDIFSCLMKERIIFISGEIAQENTDIIIAQLLWLDYNSQKDIKIYINSEGGDVQCVSALYDVMQFIKAPVSTFAIGKAFSAAAVLLCAGTKGKRYSLPNTTIMIHQPWISGTAGGKAIDMEIEAKQLKEDKRVILEIIARHTGNTYEKVANDCEYDFYLTSEQALKYGMIDAITTPQKEIPPLLFSKKTAAKK